MEKTGLEPWMERYTLVCNPTSYAMSHSVCWERLKHLSEIKK